ncbi:MAG: hypothetical protein AB1546_00255, partial [bacterium]
MVLLIITGCGGGGSSVVPDISPDTGAVSGIVTYEEISLSRTGEQSEKDQVAASIYVFPDSTPPKNLLPNPAVPNAKSDPDGKFTITAVPKGIVHLVIDYDANGTADKIKFNINVEKNQSADTGTIIVRSLNLHTKGSWCKGLLKTLTLSPGDELTVNLTGYNHGDIHYKCGMIIVHHDEQKNDMVWSSDFEDSSTFITTEADSEISGTIRMTIPSTWRSANQESESVYQVYTIQDDKAIYDKGGDFYLQCKSACSINDECDDGNHLTIDTCENPGTCGSVC